MQGDGDAEKKEQGAGEHRWEVVSLDAFLTA